jgi:predicted RNase H-like HicB family nuclease
MTSYTAKYTKVSSGYMGQLVEWPEVVTEGRDIEECRAMLRDALKASRERPTRTIDTSGDAFRAMHHSSHRVVYKSIIRGDGRRLRGTWQRHSAWRQCAH